MARSNSSPLIPTLPCPPIQPAPPLQIFLKGRDRLYAALSILRRVLLSFNLPILMIHSSQHVEWKNAIRLRLCVTIATLIGIATSYSIIEAGHLAFAQVTSDGTLSTTITTTDNLNFVIENGNRAGTNLFHSFDEFSVPTNGSAVFNNAADIETIFSRVTGNDVSDIDGLMQSNGIANLFLINPNGFIFGPNVSLGIGGSFLATTADRVLFENEQFFSATETITSPVLTISTPIGVQFGSTQNSITVQGNGHNLEFNEDFEFIRDNRPAGLAVDLEQTLALIGGDIQLEGGNITAEQGRIELGSIKQSGIASFGAATEGFTVGYDAIETFGTISLSQAASVDVSGEGSGHLHIQAGTLSLIEDSTILSDVLGSDNGGDVLLRASESIEIAGSEIGDFPSTVFNVGEVDSVGTVGTLSIEADSLSLSGGAQINASTFGEGNGENVTVEATTINIVGVSSDGARVSGIFADAYSSAQGRNLVINTDFLSVRDHGHIAAGTFGEGDGGDFFLTANTIELSGGAADFPEVATGLFVDTLSTGTAGNLIIETQTLSVMDGASILAGTGEDSTGNGGSVVIRASESINVSGMSLNFASAINSDSFSSGQGGDVLLETGLLSVSGGGQISATAFGTGDAGNLTVQADTIDITGLSPALVFSGLFAITLSSGQGGDLGVEADHISVTDGGIISAATFGSGNGGNIEIQADTMDISGAAIDFSNTLNGVTTFVAPESTNFDGTVAPPATGTGGNITITANQLSLSKGGQIDASTFGEGNAGNIQLNVEDLNLTGLSEILDDGTQIPSRILSSSETDFAAGSINITSDRLTVQDGAEINVSSLGLGDAGNLILNTGTLQLEDGGRLLAEVNGGVQGNIRLSANDLLLLRRNSSITATASGHSTGGNMTIRSPFIVAVAEENSDIVANAVQGDGGNISITTQGLFGLTFRDRLTAQSDITVSSQFGLAGIVEINNPEADPNSEVLELSNTLVDVSQLVRSGCSQNTSQFVITGRGGLTPSPLALLDGDRPWLDMRDLSAFLSNPSGNLASTAPIEQPAKIEPLQEATGIAIAPDGTFQLIAAHSHSPMPTHPTCTSAPNIS
ncbi:MAG: S-layer family protein [Cyanobacteria bacterium P01_F01_bin.150]